MAKYLNGKTLQSSGKEFEFIQNIDQQVGWGSASFSASPNALAFVEPGQWHTHLTWFDRSGKMIRSLKAVDNYGNPSFSPDEKKVVAERGSELRILDLDTENWTR